MDPVDWPFFEDRHRQLARRARDWAARHLPAFEAVEEPGVDQACRELVRLMGEAGWLAYCVPPAYRPAAATAGDASALAAESPPGDFDTRAICLLREAFARHAALADFAFAMQGLGSGAISLCGTAAQKERWLPRVAAGEAIAAFALSEPDAGSDVAAVATTARPADGGGYVLDGDKTWISNGGIADFYVVFARSGEGPGTRGLSAFVVEAGTPGLDVAERISAMAPHPLARLRLAGCRVGAHALVGQPGEGFRVAMQTLDVFRTSVAAAALGMARRARDEALRHARTRTMFGVRLADLQMTQARLADMDTALDAAALLTWRAAWARDRGVRVTREAAMAKLFATEAAGRIIDDALQLFGGLGVTRGQTVERLYREIRALRIYEGASEVQRLVIARETLRAAETSRSPS